MPAACEEFTAGELAYAEHRSSLPVLWRALRSASGHAVC